MLLEAVLFLSEYAYMSILSVRFKETICFTSPESVLKEGLEKRNLNLKIKTTALSVTK